MRLALSLTTDDAAVVLHENRGLIYDQEAAGTDADPTYSQAAQATYLHYALSLDPLSAVQQNRRALPELRQGLGLSEPLACLLLQRTIPLLRRLENKHNNADNDRAAAWRLYLDWVQRYRRRAQRAQPLRDQRRQTRQQAERQVAAVRQAEINHYEALLAVRRFMNAKPSTSTTDEERPVAG